MPYRRTARLLPLATVALGLALGVTGCSFSFHAGSSSQAPQSSSSGKTGKPAKQTNTSSSGKPSKPTSKPAQSGAPKTKPAQSKPTASTGSTSNSSDSANDNPTRKPAEPTRAVMVDPARGGTSGSASNAGSPNSLTAKTASGN